MKMDDFKMEYLADRPDCLQACAAWAYGRWGVQKKGKNKRKYDNEMILKMI